MTQIVRSNSENGFALLDAMVALAIFAVMSALLFQTVSSTVLAKRHVIDSRRAILIAQSRLAQLQDENSNIVMQSDGREGHFVWRASVDRLAETASDNSRGLEQVSVTVSNARTNRAVVTLKSARLAR
jgi:type II secretory pathway component PulJ